jgi:hypothetical protein
MTKGLTFLKTVRFDTNYERYNGERARIRAKVSDLKDKYESNPISWLLDFERLRDPLFEIYRVKITDGDRLIFAISGQILTLIDVGPHEIMEEFLALSASAKNRIVQSATTLPSWFFSNHKSKNQGIVEKSANSNGGDEMRWLYEDELNESWLQFLDVEQYKVRNEVLKDVSVPGEFQFHLILGGAGTGKTVILLNLALSLKEMGRNVVTRFSPQVLKYLNSGVQRVPGTNLEFQPGSVVLLDDPNELSDLKRTISECNRVGVRGLVVALDPFQWIERRVYEKFFELLDSLEPKLHQLNVCYRQSANVGLKALDFTSQVLDKTSPFILDSKIEAHRKTIDPLREICVEKVTFVDDGGRFRLYLDDLEANFKDEVRRIRSRIDLWKHWHPILLVEDEDGFDLPSEWKLELRGLNSVTKSIGAVEQIRGCEYQEVILLISHRTWNLITRGVLGATSGDWQKAISFHTLMTRPKDSLTIFVKPIDN